MPNGTVIKSPNTLKEIKYNNTTIWRAGSTVRYLADKGSWSGNVKDKSEFWEYGKSVLTPTFGNPSLSGYAFLGWSSTQNGNVLTSKLSDGNDFTLYARYEPQLAHNARTGMLYWDAGGWGIDTDDSEPPIYCPVCGDHLTNAKIHVGGLAMDNGGPDIWAVDSAGMAKIKAHFEDPVWVSVTYYHINMLIRYHANGNCFSGSACSYYNSGNARGGSWYSFQCWIGKCKNS